MFMVSCRVAVGCVACVYHQVCANSIRLSQCSACHTHLRSTNISRRCPPTAFSYFRQPFCKRPRFARRAFRMGFMVYKITLGQVFFLVMRCSPVSIVLAMLSVHLSPRWTVGILGRAVLYRRWQLTTRNKRNAVKEVMYYTNY
jgi:hypothetical protein